MSLAMFGIMVLCGSIGILFIMAAVASLYVIVEERQPLFIMLTCIYIGAGLLFLGLAQQAYISGF